MARTAYTTHDEYIAAFPPDVQEVLRTVRATVRKAVPDATEVVSYQIPAFRLGKAWILYYSAHQRHWTLSCPPPLFVGFEDELAAYETSKSAVRLPYGEPVPVDLIAALAASRAELARGKAERGPAKPARKPSRAAAKR